MPRRWIFVALAATATAALTTSARTADDTSQEWAACRGGPRSGFTSEEMITACSAIIIAEGQDQGKVAEAYSNRGRAEENLDQHDKALSDYNQAIRLNPENPEYYYFRSVVHFNRKNEEQSLADLATAIQKDQKYYKAFILRAQIHAAANRSELELEDLNAALAIQKDSFDAYSMKGGLYARAGYCDKGLENYQEALRIMPGNDTIAGYVESLKRQKARGDCKPLPVGRAAFPSGGSSAAGAGAQNDQDQQKFNFAMARWRSQDFKSALPVLLELANKDYAGAQWYLGRMYDDGLGVPVDYHESLRWYHKAADRGDPLAQAYLGRMYERGNGVPKNYGEAVRYYTLSANQGNSEGQAFLGAAYSLGRGVSKNSTRAFNLYHQSAMQGNNRGQFLVSIAYMGGNGVKASMPKGYAWLIMSAAAQFQSAVDMLKKVEPSMSPSDVTEGQAFATECTSRQFKKCRI